MSERFQSAANSRRQTLFCSGLTQRGSILQTNRAHLRRLVAILLDNAIKYTPPGGTIAVTFEVADALRMQVADTGCGIPQEHLARVFDRFYRIDPARTDACEGAGLGLSIAKWLTELYGGEIGITSEVARGTCITIALPATILVS